MVAHSVLNASDSELSCFSTCSAGTATTGTLTIRDDESSSSSSLNFSNHSKQGNNGGGRGVLIRKKSYMKKRDSARKIAQSPKTTGKKDTGEKSKKKTKKNVSFSTKRQVRSFQKYSQEDHSKIWYEYDELCELHEKDRVKTMRKLKYQKLGSMMTLKRSKSASDLSKNSESFTTRGIEKFLNGDTDDEQDIMVRKVVQSVVIFYQRQVRQGRYNPENLQKFASKKTLKDTVNALTLGEQDAMEVHGTTTSAAAGGRKKQLPGGSNTTRTSPKPTKTLVARSQSTGSKKLVVVASRSESRRGGLLRRFSTTNMNDSSPSSPSKNNNQPRRSLQIN